MWKDFTRLYHLAQLEVHYQFADVSHNGNINPGNIIQMIPKTIITLALPKLPPQPGEPFSLSFTE